MMLNHRIRVSILVLPQQVSQSTLMYEAALLMDIVAIAHESWIDYMDHPSTGLTGAVSHLPGRLLALPLNPHRSSLSILRERLLEL